jgi:hypothetical protein
MYVLEHEDGEKEVVTYATLMEILTDDLKNRKMASTVEKELRTDGKVWIIEDQKIYYKKDLDKAVIL